MTQYQETYQIFFQLFKDYTDIDANSSELDYDIVYNKFLANYNHTLPLTWFDEMIKHYFGIDVYQYDFPEVGYATYTHNNISLLIFRIDIPDSVKETAIREFLDFDDIHLKKSNVASNKKYAGQYASFQEKLTLPDEYLDMMCASKYTRHFFSLEEITAIKQRWRKVNTSLVGLWIILLQGLWLLSNNQPVLLSEGINLVI